MGDSVLVQVGGLLVAIYTSFRGYIAARDERERRKQKRNGGTPMDHLIREVRESRREARAMRRTLRVIARSSEDQCRLLEEGKADHRAITAALTRTSRGLDVLLDRGIREQK